MSITIALKTKRLICSVILDDEDADLAKHIRLGNGDYVYTKDLREYVPRLIAARKLNRKLRKDEHCVTINRIRTDLRRENIMIVTPTHWARTHKPKRNTSSRFKGVCWSKIPCKWRADIRLPDNQGCKFLGHYENEELAALAYNNAVKLLDMPLAFLNDI